MREPGRDARACANCAFFQRARATPTSEHPEGYPHDYGTCRSHPPMVTLGGWPTVNVIDWCGEFESAAVQKALKAMS